jgi:AcrR family transcriptional regulator
MTGIIFPLDKVLFLRKIKKRTFVHFSKKDIMPAKTKDNPTKGEVTRLAVEEAAIELFLAHGYHATSMRQIAEHAGLALGGIYNHFASKDDIFEAIIVDQHPYKRVLPLILEAEGDNAEEFLKNAARIVFAELDSRPEYLKLMFIEMVEFNGRHGALMLKEIVPKVLPIFEKMSKVRKQLRVTNPAVFMRSFFGMVMSYYLTELVSSNSVISGLMPKNTQELYVDMYLRGILKD